MKIMKTFCMLAIPNHSIATGINADAGIYRINAINGSKKACILLLIPIIAFNNTTL